MEPLSLLLILMTFLECLLIALLVYSLLSLEIFNKRFFVLIIILTIFTSLIRVLPVIPLVIVFFAIVIYTVYIRYIYKVSVVITIIVSGLSYIIYRLMEGATVFALVKIFRISYKEIVNNPSIRVLFFAIFLVFISLIVYVIRYFNINLIDVIDILGFEDLKYLAEDEVDLSREKRVTSTIYLVIIFLLIQGLFINYNILGKNIFIYFHISNFFTSPIFVNSFIIFLNLILLYLLRYLVITLRMERNDIIKRIKEKNSLRLDWEKRAEMHDRNHHLSMIYILLQVNKVDRAKEYLKGMVGEIQNVDAIVKSGNHSLNALIRSKIALGKKSGVIVEVKVKNRVKEMNIKDWDLNRIIGNLLDNAIEASERAEDTKHIELIINSNHLTNDFEVITHGVVITEEIKNHIFDKGYSSKEEEGHGLGLAICKELVDTYQGEIQIKKDTSKNCTSFQVLMPLS